MLRRRFLNTVGATAAAAGIQPLLHAVHRADDADNHIATNTYPWSTFAGRSGEVCELHSDQLLSEIASTGIAGYEPIIQRTEEFDGLGERLKKHGLEMRSLYVNSTLHEAAMAHNSIEQVIAIAKEAKKIGTHIVVTNPSPIRWGGTEDKSDAQLLCQAKALDQLGAELLKLGVTLAYHNHDAELRQGGREFHHMLTATDPKHVKLCLDSHWVFRGCGDSQVALFDVVTHYSDRIVELHLRQSVDGVWSEAFAMEGDIDYRRLFRTLDEKQIKPHYVLEQAVEGASSKTLTVVDAHRSGRASLARAL